MIAEAAIQWLERTDQWQGLASIAAIEAQRRIGRKATKETRYFITSLTGSATQLVEAVRKHWGIENSLHWVLDVTMNEGRSRIRRDHAPENLALLRRLALNLISKSKRSKASVRGTIKKSRLGQLLPGGDLSSPSFFAPPKLDNRQRRCGLTRVRPCGARQKMNIIALAGGRDATERRWARRDSRKAKVSSRWPQ